MGEKNEEGNAYHRQHDFKREIDYHERIRRIAQGLADRDGEGRACKDLGDAYERLGDFKTAIDYHKRQIGRAHV